MSYNLTVSYVKNLYVKWSQLVALDVVVGMYVRNMF